MNVKLVFLLYCALFTLIGTFLSTSVEALFEPQISVCNSVFFNKFHLLKSLKLKKNFSFVNWRLEYAHEWRFPSFCRQSLPMLTTTHEKCFPDNCLWAAFKFLWNQSGFRLQISLFSIPLLKHI